jgi:predicted MFS family arabinose efflux permease
LSRPYDVNSPGAVISAIILGTLGVLSFIVQPALVQGFVTQLKLSEPEALNLAGIEMLGVAASSIWAAFATGRMNWRWVMALALGTAAIGNVLSALMADSSSLWTARLIAGVGHGAIITLSFTFVGLTARVDRNIAWYLALLLTYGAVGIWGMPMFLDAFGLQGLFALFAVLLVAGFATVSHVPHAADARAELPEDARDLAPAQVVIALTGVLAYNLAQGIAWAVLFLVGIAAGLGEQAVANALFISQVLAIAGALASVFLAGVLARDRAIVIGIVGGAACIALLLGAPGLALFTFCVCGFNVLWNFVLPFILGTVGAFDTRGRMIGRSVAMQMLGLGLGPFIAAALIDGNDYTRVELVCVGFFIASLVLLWLPMRAHSRLVTVPALPLPN